MEHSNPHSASDRLPSTNGERLYKLHTRRQEVADLQRWGATVVGAVALLVLVVHNIL